MKEKKSNSVTHFQPEAITADVSVEFTKITDADGTTANGKITKGGANAGDISYESRNDFLVLRLKPFSALTEDEVAAVHAAVPGYIKEILG